MEAAVVAPVKTEGLEEKHYAFFNSRGITRNTVDDYSISASTQWIRNIGSGADCIGFAYRNNGVPYAYKWRAIKDKGFTCTNAPQHFYLHDRVSVGEDVVICEGEIDALSLRQAGIVNAISVPNGAPMKVSEGKVAPEEDRKFAYVWNSRNLLNAAKKVYLAIDADDPGMALGEELSRRIGRAKCWLVKWPKDCKDANDVLIKHGPEAIKAALEASEPWPVAGLFEAKHYTEKVGTLWEKGNAKGMSAGYDEVDEIYSVVPGQMTIVTGIPSSGKSEFIDQVMINLAMKNDLKFAICSFENPPEAHIVKLIEKKIGKPFFEGATERMTKLERDAGLAWVNNHFSFIDTSDGEPSTIDSILDRASSAVMRMGIRGLIIDPYNFIERDFKNSETDYISSMLTKVRNWARGNDAHVWFVAHPAKMMRTDGKVPVPGGYDISGSAAWFAKADFGMTVDRQKGPPEIHIWKCRFKWAGKMGSTTLNYHAPSGRYMSPKDVPIEDFGSIDDEGF
jgi:twinkle protein